MDSKKKPINEGYQPSKKFKKIVEIPVVRKAYGYQPSSKDKISTKGTPPKSGSKINSNDT